MGCTPSKARALPAGDADADAVAEFKTGVRPNFFSHAQLFAPRNFRELGKKPVPAMVMVHGFCFQSDLQADIRAFASMGSSGRRTDWRAMEFLAREVAKQGVVVLTIGMPENDVEVLPIDYPDLPQERKDKVHGDHLGDVELLGNGWPAVYYGRALAAAIDHVCDACPLQLQLEVDRSRIGLLGWSMGAAGALYAAGETCRDVKSVVAVNPGYISVLEPFDVATSDITASPETFAHLSTISADVFIFGSELERSEIQPFAKDLYPAISASASKELFVERRASSKQTGMDAHLWFTNEDPEKNRSYNGGAPTEALLSFVRRSLVGGAEERMPPPKTALAWRDASSKEEEKTSKEKTVADPEPIIAISMKEGNKQETKEVDLFCGDHAMYFTEGTETCLHAIALTGPTEIIEADANNEAYAVAQITEGIDAS